MNEKQQVIEGPDLNSSRSTLDEKQYRQIILGQNGLRVILISDTHAMIHQNLYEYYSDDDDDDDDDGEKGKEHEDDTNTLNQEGKVDDNNQEGNHNDRDDDEEDENEEEDEDDGIRKAAAAMIVGAGSFHDPPFAQGMAHFLEHMLFMGTEKYPGENEYSAFISKNGGCDNAYTELEHTVYHVEVCQEKLFEALDMFSQFFIAPLMLKDAVDRELNIIESEFQLSKNSDECRLQKLLCHDCGLQGQDHDGKEKSGDIRKQHPFSSFSWGNIQSLKHIPEKNGIDMMKELRNFYNRYYYAQNMSLVVMGAYTLDELEKHVVQSFSQVPALPRVAVGVAIGDDEERNGMCHDTLDIQRENAGTWNVKVHTPIQDFGMPFGQEALGRICRIVPVKDRHTLSVTWQLPPQWEHWKSKPCDYIAHLLGHEAAGSLLSALKEKSWVNECYAGVGTGGYENASSHALFSLTLTISVEGVSHWTEILQYVYYYIGMIRHYCKRTDDRGERGLPIWIYEELRAIQQVSYEFADETDPIDFVEDMADRLTPYSCLPPERLLDGDDLLFEFDNNTIQMLLDEHFSPFNARVDIMSSTFGRASDFDDHKTNLENKANHVMNSTHGDATKFCVEMAGEPLIEPIFGTRYWSHKIPNDLLMEWEKARGPKLPPKETEISLPPMNPFVPKKFDLKMLPEDDGHHPLLFCSLKICVSIGKTKSWFPCTCNRYDGTLNKMLLGMEDGEEVWHLLDMPFDEFQHKRVMPDFEGTFDNKTTKFRVISVPKNGEGAVMKYGDESDWHVEDGIHFPHIPPPLPESRLPSLVVNTNLLKLWHLQDRKFKRPIGEFRIRIACANANKTPLHKACAELMAILLRDATTETCYLASVCELGNDVEANDVGFSIRVHGFDDKVLDLTTVILDVFFSFRKEGTDLPPAIKHHRFESCLEILRRRYGNAGMKASSLCSDIRLRCLMPTVWSSTSKANAIVNITPFLFMKTISDIMSKVSMECLYMGNFDKNDAALAKEILVSATASLKAMQKKQFPKQEVIVTPTCSFNIVTPTIDPQEPNTAVEVYFQCGKDDLMDRVTVDLLVQIMYEPLYDQVRTKEQFGYQVSCGCRWTHGVIGLCFKIVTNCKSAEAASIRIEKFLVDTRANLVQMSQKSLMEHIVALANNKLQKFNSLEEEADCFWSEIVENRYDFEVHRKEAEALRNITKDHLLQSFDQWLSASNAERRKLEIRTIGTSEGMASEGRPIIGRHESVAEII
eukprot:CAMPEP_0176481116 /NCGR_PEP_ID=MMETSP0200_2-20121128/2644_1 /TAXON_ID=947934 /ORGANISM="Chaetoceros sp., Strain GSL56" /LENGTH=1248 /DNA_ID=CAMNT_0017877291 /DNA_START=89 /DNA_END=3832 /DNA_ORIENTATION=-